MGKGESITLALAVLGAVLGVINTVWSLYRDRVRLDVAAVWMNEERREQTRVLIRTSEFPDALISYPSGRVGIRVRNLGLVEITIDQVGFSRDGWWRRRFSKRRHTQTLVSDALEIVKLPHRLLPRESVTIWGGSTGNALLDILRPCTRVVATTACGKVVYGTSPLLRTLLKQARSQ